MSTNNLFADSAVNLDLLRQRAFNLRWATLPADVIPLTAADPDFPIAAEIRAALQGYAEGGVLSYGPAEGLASFRETVARTLAERRGIACTAAQILPVSGAAHGMVVVAQHVLRPGDEAIIFDPVDFLFKKSVESAGGVAVLSQVDAATRAFDIAGIRRLITPRTRLIGVCNPHNPLGRVLRREELEALGQLAIEHDLLIMADEIWSDIIYPPHRHISMAALSPEIAQRTLTVFGFSKTFGLAGLRVGYVVAPSAAVCEALLETSQMRTTAYGVAPIAQVAAAVAYTSGWYWADAFIEHLTSMRDLAVAALNAIDGIWCREPEGTYLLFPNITATGLSSQAVCDYLLEHHKVAVVPGAAQWFGPGAEGHIRICFATSEQILRAGLERIGAGLRELVAAARVTQSQASTERDFQ